MARIVMANPVMAVPHFLLACYMYYVEDDPLLQDSTFDLITSMLLKDPSLRRRHHHGHLITDEHLEAGTGFDLKYPLRVIEAAGALRRSFEKQRV